MKSTVFHSSLDMAERLAAVLKACSGAIAADVPGEQDLGFVLAAYAPGCDEAEIAAHNGGLAFYPASVVKLGWALVALERLEAGSLEAHPELERSLTDMLGVSSNAATNYVVDCLTGTTGDTLLHGADFAMAMETQQGPTRRLAACGWPEWERCQIVQKASDEDRYGRHMQFRDALGHNVLTPLGAARLLHESLFANSFSAGVTQRMRGYLARPVDAAAIAAEPISQVVAFLGGGLAPHLPAGSLLYSKAGWSMYTGDPGSMWHRHDAAFAALPDGSGLLSVVLTNGERAAKSETLLPALGGAIADACLPLSGLPRDNGNR